jgi:VWFA-related protein
MRPWQVVLAVVMLLAVARPDRAPEARGRSAGAHSQERAAPAGPTHHIYITAVGKDGIPVKDLAAADIRVREDGTVKPVVAVQAATAPLTIALLVDDTGPGLRYIREGAGQFIQRLAGHAEIALISIAKNITLIDYTTRVEQLYNGVRQLQTQNVASAVDGAYLLDAAHDAIQALQEREAERPVIVVLTLETAEFSSRRADPLLDALQRSRAMLHVVALGKPVLKTMTAWNEGPMQSLRENLDETGNRHKFLEQGTKRSGGRLEQVLVDSGVPGAMLSIADELASQFVVVYSRGGATVMPPKIEVSANRSGIRVRKAGANP